MEQSYSYEESMQLKRNELREKKDNAQLLTHFQLDGKMYEIRKMKRFSNPNDEEIVLGLYDENGPHVWFNGYWTINKNNTIEFLVGGANNLDLTIDEEKNKLVRKDSHVHNLAATMVGELVSQNIIHKWRSSIVQSEGGKKIYSFLKTDPYWEQQVSVSPEPNEKERMVVTKRNRFGRMLQKVYHHRLLTEKVQ